jgi:hypothetical protein
MRTQIEIRTENFGQPLFDGKICKDKARMGKTLAECQPLFFIAGSKQYEMPDSAEAERKNMQQKATDEFICGKRHHFIFVVVAVIPEAEHHTAVIGIENTIVGDSDPMGIPTEVIDDLLYSPERRFAIDDPIRFVQFGYECTVPGGIVKILRITPEVQIFFLKIMQKLSTKHLGHDFDREEEFLASGLPSSDIRKPSARYDAMQMRMIAQVLPPCVKYAGNAGRCAEIFFVGTERQKRLGYGFKQQSVHFPLVLHKNRSKFGGDCKYRVEIRGIQKVVPLFFNPSFFRKCLTLRAVPVAT